MALPPEAVKEPTKVWKSWDWFTEENFLESRWGRSVCTLVFACHPSMPRLWIELKLAVKAEIDHRLPFQICYDLLHRFLTSTLN